MWEWGWKSSGKGKPSFVVDMFYGEGGQGAGMWPTDEAEQEKSWSQWQQWWGASPLTDAEKSKGCRGGGKKAGRIGIGGPPVAADKADGEGDEEEGAEGEEGTGGPVPVVNKVKKTKSEKRQAKKERQEAGLAPMAPPKPKVPLADLPMPVRSGRLAPGEFPAAMPRSLLQVGKTGNMAGKLPAPIAVGRTKARIKLTIVPVTGEIIEFTGDVATGGSGLIKPHAAITHAMASKRDGNVYFSLPDLAGLPDVWPEWVAVGSIVQFQAYADMDGLGAEDVNTL